MRVASKAGLIRPGDVVYLGGVPHTVRSVATYRPLNPPLVGSGKVWVTLYVARHGISDGLGESVRYRSDMPLYRWKPDDDPPLEYEAFVVVPLDRESQPRTIEKAVGEYAVNTHPALFLDSTAAHRIAASLSARGYAHKAQRVLLRYRDFV
jgi:hypothetical protein